MGNQCNIQGLDSLKIRDTITHKVHEDKYGTITCIPRSNKYECTLIHLHGFMSSPLEHFNWFVGSNCFPARKELFDGTKTFNCKVIFLSAPERLLSRGKGKGLAWYDNIGRLGKMKDHSSEHRATLFN